MNKFNGIFGQILQIFPKAEFNSAVYGDRSGEEGKSGKKGKRIRPLGTVRRHVVLSTGTGPFLYMRILPTHRVYQ
jgi:hypothetical protein